MRYLELLAARTVRREGVQALGKTFQKLLSFIEFRRPATEITLEIPLVPLAQCRTPSDRGFSECLPYVYICACECAACAKEWHLLDAAPPLIIFSA